MGRTTHTVCAGLSFLLLLILFSSVRTTLAAALSLQRVQRPAQPQVHHFLPISQFHLRGMNGPYHTQGNLIYGADNHPYLFHGIARDDLEYFCKGDGHYTAKDLAYMGTGTGPGTYWGGNTVRLPLSEGFWLYGQPSQNCTPEAYQALVKQTIDTLTSLNLNVIIDLEWTDAGGQALGAGTQLAMPDADSVTFWQQVASLYARYPNVLFELFNEPHIYNWSCWLNGCPISGDQGTNKQYYSYQSVGMQKLLDTVRAAGATNLALIGGIDWGYNLSQLPTYHLHGTNIVYDTHPYDYYGKQPSNWEADFGTVSSTYPLFAAELGEYDCGTNYVNSLIDYLDAHNISWIGWAWVVADGNPCKYPQVIKDYQGTPVQGMGEFEYRRMRGYVDSLVNSETPEKKK